MAELPIAPGEPYIEVEYDYEYKAKDRVVAIRQGECYLLVKKTNEDWWQVRREEGTKAFYVPAQYVREVRKALMPPPPKPLPLLPPQPQQPKVDAGALWVKPNTLDLVHQGNPENLHRRASAGHPAAPPPARQSPPSQRRNSSHHPPAVVTPTEHDRALADILLHGGAGGAGGAAGAALQPPRASTLPRSRARSPDPVQAVQAPLGADRARRDSAGDERRNDSESEFSSSSTEHLQAVSGSGSAPARSDSPVYTNLQELKLSVAPPPPGSAPLQVQGEWETHRDPTGRHFYYHRSSGERTWKPPRAKDASSGSSRGESAGESSEWLKHVDDQGRAYYCNADGSRSEWELPKFTLAPPHPSGDVPKSRSLDRKQEPIVLTKWRLSSYSQDPNDKLLVKTRRLRSGSARRHPYKQQDAPLSPKPSTPDSDSCPSSPKTPTSPSEKCGILNVTKITEHGKKVRKNWTSSWTVLEGSTLLIDKGQGGGTSWFGGGQSKPEFTVDLRGGSVEWASKDKSSKKHVLEVKTRHGTELLIQSENEGLVNDWHRAIQDAICTHASESDDAIEDEAPESPVADRHEHRDSKKGRVMKTSSSVDASDNKKTRHKLKKFLTRRPTLQSVRDKGYIKDQVFGCSLAVLCQREGGNVPEFVRMCIQHVENNGLCVDGLYRVSGNLAIIQKLRFAVNHDERVTLSDGKWEDIHVTTGALKMFFRELPEPLFSYTLFHDFVSAIKNPDYKLRVQTIRDLVQQLPKPNHHTMQALFQHLRRVVEHGEENRMTTQSVAIVFGPTLLRPENETWNIAVHMVYQNQIVELILLEYHNVFGR